MTRAQRIAWRSGIVLIAALTSIAHRHAVTPDGISYLDLSDAVVFGRLPALLNTYWSPLYPLLVGITRLIGGAGAHGEVAAMHVVNFLACIGALAAFEWFCIPLRALVQRGAAESPITRWWDAIAYAVFATQFLPMNSLELTTPDTLSNAAIFVVLGGLLRLRDSAASNRRRAAVATGAALGIGLLAKSFLVPWGVVCIIILALDRRVDRRSVAIVTALFAVVLVPWTIALSSRAHRLTFGDAGRLTFAWYVNQQYSPSSGLVPPGARNVESERLMPGIGVMRNSEGTDPMWYDPARWNRGIAPHFDIAAQINRLGLSTLTLLGNLSAIIFLAFVLLIQPRASLRAMWDEGWPVLVACGLAIGAYALVIDAGRYIAAFVTALVLVILSGISIARVIRPVDVLAGLGIALVPFMLDGLLSPALSLNVAIVASLLVGVLVRMDRIRLWIIAVAAAFALAMANLPPGYRSTTTVVGVALGLVLWRLSATALRRGEGERFSLSLQWALAVCFVLFALLRLAPGVITDVRLLANGDQPLEWRIADDLAAHHVAPGTSIALVGPHAESYWMRSARVHLVANVPAPLAPVWWNLTPERRDSVLAYFHRAGANVAIVTPPVPPNSLDASWTALPSGGWLKWLDGSNH